MQIGNQIIIISDQTQGSSALGFACELHLCLVQVMYIDKVDANTTRKRESHAILLQVWSFVSRISFVDHFRGFDGAETIVKGA